MASKYRIRRSGTGFVVVRQTSNNTLYALEPKQCGPGRGTEWEWAEVSGNILPRDTVTMFEGDDLYGVGFRSIDPGTEPDAKTEVLEKQLLCAKERIEYFEREMNRASEEYDALTKVIILLGKSLPE